MNQFPKIKMGPIWLGVLAGMSLMVMAGSAAAQTWNFCSPPKTTTIEYNTPSAMLMLDRSGSMETNKSAGKSLWNVAKDSLVAVVEDLTADTPDQVRFGLGFFGATYQDMAQLNANVVFEAKENALVDLKNRLNNTLPGGYTPTGDAIERVRRSGTLNDSTRPSAGVLITDGTPQTSSGNENIETNRVLAVQQACTMRGEGKSLYVVGLGGATNTAFNNKLAAAAGKGCCGLGANVTCSNGIGTDPCQNPGVDPNTCFGSYEAYNQTEFTNVLKNIAQEISCTFELDTNSHPNNMAPDNPDAVIVRMKSATGMLDISHRSHDPAPVQADKKGWFFANENRNSITLTPYYCAKVQSGDAEFVETQVACPCTQVVGSACDVPGQLPPLICPQGTWSCDSGFDVCEPVALEECPVGCPGYDIDAPCHTDDVPVSITGQGANNPLTERNRCKIGKVACENNVRPYCQQLYSPMPELCDGLDNDCDGQIDNITASWTNKSGVWTSEEFEMFSIPSDHEKASAACFNRDVCVCDSTGISTHNAAMMTPVNYQAEFDAYLNAWDPTYCECRAGLGR